MSIYDDAVAHSQQPQADPATQARAGMAVAVGTNPDAYAAAVRLSKITGVPVETAQMRFFQPERHPARLRAAVP